jgi:hypothetical protein
MKNKTLFLITLITALISSANSRAGGGDAFEQGKIIISAGYGFSTSGAYFRSLEKESNYSAKFLGPIAGKFEYGASDKVGIGISFNYRSFDVNYSQYGTVDTVSLYTSGYKGKQFSVLARINTHFGTTDKLDFYWGLGIGYRGGNRTFYTTDPQGTDSFSFKTLIPLGFETTLGVRYFFTDNIGVYVEAGLAKSLVQGGLAVKF